jgi:hypothetical protein
MMAAFFIRHSTSSEEVLSQRSDLNLAGKPKL